VITPETNEHHAGCALKRIFGRLDFRHLESNSPIDLDLRFGMAAYSRKVDANVVLTLGEKRQHSGRTTASADQPYRDLAKCAPQVGSPDPGIEL